MSRGRPVSIGVAVCGIALALAGCRERQVPAGPAVSAAPAGGMSAAPAVSLEAGTLDSARPSLASCSFDSVGDRYFKDTLAVTTEVPLHLRGWLSNEQVEPAGSFLLVLAGEGGAWAVQAQTGVARPDVSAYFDAPALGTSGFDLFADFAPVPRGTYAIVLLQEVGTASLTCATGKRLLLQ